ncbi:MAG: hypothetical protein C4315_03050 [Chloroflexota bacterium]
MARVLILEDDTELRKTYRQLLGERHKLWVWSSKEAARLWELLAQGYALPELAGFGLIISSAWLELGPEEHCSERLVRALRQRFLQVPVILAGRSPTVPTWVRLIAGSDPGVRALFPVNEQALKVLVEELLGTTTLKGGV